MKPHESRTRHYNGEPVKSRWTAKELSEEWGVTQGLIFCWSGKLKLGTRDSDPRKFTRKEVERLKKELK